LNGKVDDHFRLMIARLGSLIPRAIAGALGANAGCACNGPRRLEENCPPQKITEINLRQTATIRFNRQKLY